MKNKIFSALITCISAIILLFFLVVSTTDNMYNSYRDINLPQVYTITFTTAFEGFIIGASVSILFKIINDNISK